MQTPPTKQLLATHRLARRAMEEGDYPRARAVLQLLDVLLTRAVKRAGSGALDTLLLECLGDLSECELQLDNRPGAAAALQRARHRLELSMTARGRKRTRFLNVEEALNPLQPDGEVSAVLPLPPSAAAPSAPRSATP